MMSFDEMFKDKTGRQNGAPLSLIEKAERELHTGFAHDYKEYLQAVGYTAFNGHELTGLRSPVRLDVVSVTQEEKQNTPSVPSDWYVIEQANIDGIVIWQDASGAVYQTIPGAEPERICNSLCEYVEM